MDNFDIENAITTLNLFYFYRCATKQNITQTTLEDSVVSHFSISREQAKHFIYCAALNYHLQPTNTNCITFVIGYIQDNLYRQ